MFHPWKNLSFGSAVALQFIGDDHSRYIRQPFEEFAKELLRGLLVTAALDQDIKDVPVLIHRPPEILAFAFDCQKHFVHLPLVTGPGASATELIGIVLSEFTAPFANRLIRHDYTAFKQSLLDITEAQAEPKVQPYRVADDLYREAMILVSRGGWWCVHALITSHHADALPAFQQVDNALACVGAGCQTPAEQFDALAAWFTRSDDSARPDVKFATKPGFVIPRGAGHLRRSRR